MSGDLEDLEARRAAALVVLDHESEASADIVPNDDNLWTRSPPICLAKSVDTDSLPSANDGPLFRDLKWTPDGTTLHTTRDPNIVESYEIPPSLLQQPPGTNEPITLQPISSHRTPTSIYATAAPSLLGYAQSYLISCANMPIRLVSPNSASHVNLQQPSPDALYENSSSLIASYPLILPETDAHRPVYSLLPFSSALQTSNLGVAQQDDRLWAGSQSSIALFDLSRPNEEPVSTYVIGRKTRNVGLAGMGDAFYDVRGPISALSLSSARVLAAGTYQRWVGLYDGRRGWRPVTTWSLSSQLQSELESGAGVSSLHYSSDDHYLYIAERKACAMQVWDMRMFQRLGFLAEREAMTLQRMGVSLVPGGDQGTGQNIMAMGTSGNVQIYADPHLHLSCGIMYPSASFRAHDDSAAAIAHHPTVHTAIATASGTRSFQYAHSDDSSSDHSTLVGSDAPVLKLWVTPSSDFS